MPPLPVVDELQLDERIALLAELRTREDPDVDGPTVTAELGLAWIERYQADPTQDEPLLTGLVLLQEAVQGAPGHEDRLAWWMSLGYAHLEIAARRQSVADYDRAIEWSELALGELAADDPDRDLIAAGRIEACWDRFQLLRYGDDADPAMAGRHADRLFADVHAYEVGDNEPGAADVALMYHGLAQLERHTTGGDRAHLDDGVAALARAMPRVPPDLENVPLALTQLADAYRKLARLDGDRRNLDLAISTGEAAARAVDSDLAISGLIHLHLAWAYKDRWQITDDPADLDGAIECWSLHMGGELDHSDAANCGDLLRQRASLTGDPTDIAAAVDLLEFAARTTPEHDALWQPWHDLALAHQVEATILDRPDRLDAALGCVDRALELLPDSAHDDDVLIMLHNTQISIASDAMQAEYRAARGGQSSAAAQMRRLLADGGAALESATAARPDFAALFAWQLARAEFGVCALDAGTLNTAHILDLLERTARVPDAHPDLRASTDMMRGYVRFLIDVRRTDGSGEEGLAEVVEALNTPGLAEAARKAVRSAARTLLAGRASRGGDLRGQRVAAAALTHAEQDPETRLLGLIMSVFGNHLQGGDQQTFLALAKQVDELSAAIPRTPAVELYLMPFVNALRQIAAVIEERPVEVVELDLPAEALGRMDPQLVLCTRVMVASARYLRAIQLDDLTLIRSAVEELTALENAMPDETSGGVFRLGLWHMAGGAWLSVAQRDPTDQDAVRHAVRMCTKAFAVTDRGRPMWATVALNLARALRMADSPDLPRTRDLGRDALRGHTWQVLIQAGTEYALKAASAATADAMTVAGWCIADRAYGELLPVLDAGRGLVLWSARSSRDIADHLAAAGHAALAAEWQATAGFGRDRVTGTELGTSAEAAELPDDLRDRVVRALAAGPAATALFADIELDEVGAALTVAGADALVYLVPATAECPGTAVLVRAVGSGTVEPLPLPDLSIDEGSPIGRWVESSPGARDAPRDVTAPAQTGAALDQLCRWAWTVCLGPLVGHVDRWRLDRPARLVLIPMGRLGVVPWHAGYRPTGDGPRYAIHDLVLSYAVSVRQFVSPASRPSRPIASALVVGDPGGDLAFADVEARAIQRTFYPDGTYFGHGTATPAQVLDWVADATGPSMLHFACHGLADPRFPADAHLVLAGGERLAARTLLDASRLAALELDRVFLAACTTNAIGTDYDEAFSLATCFLAAGANTVFGSLWPVPDMDTSLLMYLVHHFLNAEGRAPADALREAQLWMLDPRREAPTGMPDELVRFCDDPALGRPMAWAGFSHLGR